VNNQIEDQIIDYADGVTQTFTLVQPSTATALLVSINGTMQQPSGATPAYTVSGNQITFAQPPLATDIIDIRFIASTVTPDLSGFSGNIGTSVGGTVNFGHGVVYATANAATLMDSVAVSNVGTGDTAIDRFSTASYRSAKYVVSVSNINTLQYQTSEVLLVHNGTTANVYVYGTIYTGASSLLTFKANVVSGNLTLYGTGSASGNNVKITKTLISV
jgi:hypothetical protein